MQTKGLKLTSKDRVGVEEQFDRLRLQEAASGPAELQTLLSKVRKLPPTTVFLVWTFEWGR